MILYAPPTFMSPRSPPLTCLGPLIKLTSVEANVSVPITGAALCV